MKSDAQLKIGVTMRASHATGYVEPRDGLARAWIDVMGWALPEAAWMPMPNAGESCIDLARKWQLNGLILTGGDDIGADPQRDMTERALLRWAIAERAPVLGVCRGMQLIATEAGGRLSPCEPASHVATRHEVRFIDDFAGLGLAGQTHEVNSFHAFGITRSDLPRPLRPLAIDGQNLVEALVDDTAPRLGLMWHPERQSPRADLDRALIRSFFLNRASK